MIVVPALAAMSSKFSNRSIVKTGPAPSSGQRAASRPKSPSEQPTRLCPGVNRDIADDMPELILQGQSQRLRGAVEVMRRNSVAGVILRQSTGGDRLREVIGRQRRADRDRVGQQHALACERRSREQRSWARLQF